MSARRRPPASEEEQALAATAPPGHVLGPAISAYLHDQGLSAIAAFGIILDAWPEVAGSDAVRHCRPRRIEGDELVVETDEPAWSTELVFRSRSILDALAAREGCPALRGLKVHVRTRFGVE